MFFFDLIWFLFSFYIMRQLPAALVAGAEPDHVQVRLRPESRVPLHVLAQHLVNEMQAREKKEEREKTEWRSGARCYVKGTVDFVVPCRQDTDRCSQAAALG